MAACAYRNDATRQVAKRVASTVVSSHQAGELGFEPRQADPESAVLPLHHSPGYRESILTGGIVLDKASGGVRWTPTREARRLLRDKGHFQSSHLKDCGIDVLR